MAAEFEIWTHLFLKGEYGSRERILSGLTKEMAEKRPAGTMHNIYEELWHMTKWQNIVVNSSQEEYEKWMANNDSIFPRQPLASQEEFDELKRDFLAGLEKAVSITKSPESMAVVLEGSYTVKDNLLSLAVHNAYHLGKIVAIRQAIGFWPPEEVKQ